MIDMDLVSRGLEVTVVVKRRRMGIKMKSPTERDRIILSLDNLDHLR